MLSLLYFSVFQTEIYVEVDEVPVTGISASERVSVPASATVNSGSAMDTLVGFHRLDTTLSLRVVRL